MSKIKEIAIENRPREKALKYGVDSLNDEELLSLIIGSGTKKVSVTEIAENILSTYNSLANFSLENYMGLSQIHGIKKSKALLLLAIFEFHKRVLFQKNSSDDIVKNANDIYSRYYTLSMHNQEVFYLLILNKRNKIIKEVELYKGTSFNMDVSVREILYQVLIGGGDAFIAIHNHPSGNVTPSEEDVVLTKRLYLKAAELSIVLKDHIIITKESYYSFKEHQNELK